MADGVESGAAAPESGEAGLLAELLSPINLFLIFLCLFLLYKIIGGRRQASVPSKPRLPPMKKRDFSPQELQKFDGRGEPETEEGRILIAVNGKVFDVSRGRAFYGPEGPYGIFAGRDASRGLGTFSVDKEAIRDEYDDLSDLNAMQWESIREWEQQFQEKYDYVGRLLKPGEEPHDYTDEEDVKEAEQSKERTKDD
ncbi:PREDICTED: membrane-associated progesterone receptor component 1-like [Branchiostoma belcheri]|uniref:Membrane-associated progesterone receptor component 1-like n=1 Tax=Branchiostoma belcheri TaxID=7741 RepID=A0A6P4YW50_BRABE|nr:PREDICTED: membrane-associated progesterone receptor component 1-like [Branchiostoma belcheri]KAI8502944.1 steroid binding [Branchiostoma belcheri]